MRDYRQLEHDPDFRNHSACTSKAGLSRGHTTNDGDVGTNVAPFDNEGRFMNHRLRSEIYRWNDLLNKNFSSVRILRDVSRI